MEISPRPALAPRRVPLVGTWANGAVLVLAVVIRLGLFPLADNKQADAPMRALLAERMNTEPGAAGNARGFCQFGPLPIEVMRPFLALFPDARWSSRVPSLIAGIALFIPFFSLAARMLGDLGGGVGGCASAVALAGLALALAPLPIQVSITAASEALYLLWLLAALDRLHAALSSRRRIDFVLGGLFASLAAVTRYDTWIALPVSAAAAWTFGARDRRALVDLTWFLGMAALCPAAYLLWSWKSTGDPFMFARYIARDHAAMAAAAVARLGGALARIRQLEVWVISFAAAMTPVAFFAAAGLPRTWRKLRPATRVVLVTGLAPPGAYLAKGLLWGDFEPLPRFAIAPGVVLLPLAAAALIAFCRRFTAQRRAPGVWLVGGALALNATVSYFAFARSGRIWTGMESLAPLTRLDAEDRALADYLRVHRQFDEGVFIDTFSYNDITVAHAARVPATRSSTLAWTRTPGRTLAETRALTGASWFAVYADSWGRRPWPDWPPDGQRFGGWTLVHVPTGVASAAR